MSKNSLELENIRNQETSELLDLYWEQGLSHTQIADTFKVSPTAVRNLFQSRDIKSRTNAQSQTAINKHRFKKLNYLQEQLVYGSLLGDACLNYEKIFSNKTGHPIDVYKISFYHSEKFIEYVYHKREVIGKGVKTKKEYKLSKRVSGLGSLMIGFSFCHTPTLKKVALLCHDKNHKKRISEKWLKKIRWPGLAYWYQDDGSVRITGKYRTLCFSTDSFSLDEIGMLKNLLRNFGFNPTHSSTSKKNQFIITLNRKDEIKKFIKGIKPFLLPCMEYKIRKKGLYRNVSKM